LQFPISCSSSSQLLEIDYNNHGESRNSIGDRSCKIDFGWKVTLVLVEEVLVNSCDSLNNFGHHEPHDEVIHVFLNFFFLILTFSISRVKVYNLLLI